MQQLVSAEETTEAQRTAACDEAQRRAKGSRYCDLVTFFDGSRWQGARADLPPPTSGGMAAPAFLHEPPVQVVFSNMTGALVSCSASGQPRPVISWTNESGSPIDHIPGLRRGRPDGTLGILPFPRRGLPPGGSRVPIPMQGLKHSRFCVQPKRPCQSR
ncbi:hypothetical protein MRX96_048179 [Rhipicephalus microplus]